MVYPFALKEKRFLSPEKTVAQLGLKEGDVVIEFGSGPGYWTIPLAKTVGAKGSVLAIDNREQNLMIVKIKSEKELLKNIKLYKAPYNSTNVPIQDKADLILFSNILSISDTWKRLIVSAGDNAKPGTKMIIIDWSIKKFVFGEKDLKNWTEDIIIEARKGGFEFKKLLDVGDFHFGLYFEFV